MRTHRFRSSFDRLIALWVLRAFSRNLARPCFICGSNYADSDIAEFLGPTELEMVDLAKIPQLLDDLHASLEKASVSLPAQARNNFTRFAASLRLNATEQRILEFFACSEIQPVLADTGRVIRKFNATDSTRLLSNVLGLPRSVVAKAVSPGSRLMKCGLLKKSENPRRISRLEFHSEALASHLLGDSYNPGKLLKSFGVIAPPPPELGLEDSPQKPGVNVLIHGSPGTGKTQLVRVLGRALDIPVYELDTSDEDGDPLHDIRRLAALNLAQTYFATCPTLLVFDEAEDILTPTLTNRGAANSHKGWFNQTLENNPQPVFWISNSIESLDPAFSRRFDLILEVPIPPKSQPEIWSRPDSSNILQGSNIFHPP